MMVTYPIFALIRPHITGLGRISICMGWMPIGALDDNTSVSFTGSLDGHGFTISNMRIDRPNMLNVGLFGRLDGTAKLSDIRLLAIHTSGLTRIGGLVGMSSGTIMNAYAAGRVVPARGVHIDGVWYVMIRSYTNSVYAVAHNPVSLIFVQWSSLTL
jgi:hypothetical protein